MTVIETEPLMLACWRMSCLVLVLRMWKNNKVILPIHNVQRYCLKKPEISFRYCWICDSFFVHSCDLCGDNDD